jgi:hypothetical protein
MYQGMLYHVWNYGVTTDYQKREDPREFPSLLNMTVRNLWETYMDAQGNLIDGIYYVTVHYEGRNYQLRYVVGEYPASMGTPGKAIWINNVEVVS